MKKRYIYPFVKWVGGKSGLINDLDMFKSKQIKSVIDYVLGVEVGLDSNAKKNRTGKLMEKLIEIFIKELCGKYSYKYIDKNLKK